MKYTASRLRANCWYCRTGTRNYEYIYILNIGEYISYITSWENKNFNKFDFNISKNEAWNALYSYATIYKLDENDREKEIFMRNLFKNIFNGDHDYFFKNNNKWGT